MGTTTAELAPTASLIVIDPNGRVLKPQVMKPDPPDPDGRLRLALECRCHNPAQKRYEFASSHCQRHPQTGQ